MLYLCVDQGGTSSRTAVSDYKGNIIAMSRVTVATIRKNKHIEQCPNKVLDSVLQSMHHCLCKLTSVQKEQLSSAALVCQRSSLIAVCKSTAKPLTNIISWQDTRGDKILGTYEKHFANIQKVTGLRANAHYGASKIKWLLAHNDSVKSAANENNAIFLPLASYLIHALTSFQNHQQINLVDKSTVQSKEQPKEQLKNGKTTSEFVVDPANASRTLLMDSEHLDWSSELLETFDLDKDLLPRIQPTSSDFGVINIENLNLNLNYVNGDQSSAFYGFGKPLPDQYLVNIGTGAFISCLANRNIHDDCSSLSTEFPLLQSIVHQKDNDTQYVIEGTVNGAGAALDVIASELGIDKTTISNRDLIGLARENNKDSLIFINGIGGAASPFWLPDLKSYFIGEGNNFQKLVAVRESIAFSIVLNIELMESSLNPKLSNKRRLESKVVVSGGLSNDGNLCQLIADLLQITVDVPAESEASITGSIWWLAGSPANWQCNHIEKTYKPIKSEECSESSDSLRTRYILWQKEMKKLTA